MTTIKPSGNWNNGRWRAIQTLADELGIQPKKIKSINIEADGIAVTTFILNSQGNRRPGEMNIRTFQFKYDDKENA